jgi:hypothetical protein
MFFMRFFCFRLRLKAGSAGVLCVCLIVALMRLMQADVALAQKSSSPISSSEGMRTVSGIIQEAASGEAVIGVTTMLVRDTSVSVSVVKPVAGARTNKFGFYSLPNVPPGTYYLVVRGVGYETAVRRVVVQNEDVRVSVVLAVQSVRGQSVTVEAERDAAPTRNISVVELKADFAKKMPVLGGESDIFRVLQLMPGIQSGSEISSGLYVRGGSPDQNLILLDGVVVYNPSHLGGFLSVFNTDALRDVRVIKGAFPAEYGGRLSSVIDLTMKEGSKEKISGTANVSLIASRLTVEGPIGENASFMLSGRRTYFDALVALVAAAAQVPQPPQYFFYDLNAKLNWKLSENDHLYLSGYFGRDALLPPPASPNQPNFGGLDFTIDWGNATGNLRWMHVVSPTLFTNFSAIYTDYIFGLGLGLGAAQNGGEQERFTTVSQIRDFTLRGEAQWFPVQEHNLKFGVDATYHRFQTLVEATTENRQIRQIIDELGSSETIHAVEASVYAQDEWQITPELSANLGFRLSYFQLGNRLLPEPRASFSYAVSDAVSLRGAFAVANQFLHLVIRNDLPLPSDTWFPSTERINPANSTQYVLGAEFKPFGEEYVLSVEGYYKSMRHLYEFRDDANFFQLAPAENLLTEGVGEAYGVEFFLNKRIGAFTGWIGYTLSWTTRTFAELNNGRPFFPRYDRRHDISVVLNYKLSDAWELGAAWVFATGQAFTMPSAQFSFTNSPYLQSGNWGSVQYTERNGARLPDYHRLDVNLTHYFTWFDLPWNLSINIYNVYNRLNPFAMNITYRQNISNPWQWVYNPAAPTVPNVEQITLFPIFPSIGIGFNF